MVEHRFLSEKEDKGMGMNHVVAILCKIGEMCQGYI